MSDEGFYNRITKSIIDLDKEKAIKLAGEAINNEMNILEVIEKGYSEGIRKVGDLWHEGELFLPELMIRAKIVQECLELLIPQLGSSVKSYYAGKVVMATIEGDIHSIGKTIVSTMLRAYGFEVFDLGVDVPAEKIINFAIEKNADIIGVSALLTTTMIGQKKVVELLIKKGLRNRIKVILGGAPLTENWVKETGADGYGANAVNAVDLVKSLLGP